MDYILRRLAGMIPVLFFTWTVVFVVIQVIPGDPVNLMLAGVPASEEVRANERARLGLDRPVVERYVTFLGKALKGDLGESFRTRQPVGKMIMEQARPTIELALGGLLVGLLMGLALGILAGIRPNSWIDTTCMTLALVGVSLPSFWIGMMLIYVFGIMLGWVPIVGRGLPALILPSITVGLYVAGGFARLVRSSIIDAMGQDYIRTARAKGLSRAKVVFKHALRNAMIPPITLLGVQIGVLIGGAVVTENVFARPGLGTMLVDAVLTKDMPLVQALVVYTTAAYLLVNLTVDILYGVIDPRIRLRRADELPFHRRSQPCGLRRADGSCAASPTSRRVRPAASCCSSSWSVQSWRRGSSRSTGTKPMWVPASARPVHEILVRRRTCTDGTSSRASLRAGAIR